MSAPDQPTAVVAAGPHVLEYGSADGTFALYAAEPEYENARALADALGTADEEPPAEADLLRAIEEDAAAVTARCEKCVGRFIDLAQGRALDPHVLSEEVDDLLGLLEKLDRSGRHKEALRLARDLSGLLALLLRWLDLVRSVRLALRLARSLGDRPAEAWALHELGTLHLGAGDPAPAETHLREAVRIKEELGRGYGRCASRHNLDAARRDLIAMEAATRARQRRLLRLIGFASILALLASSTVAFGYPGVLRNARSTIPVTTPTTTTSGTGSATTSTTTTTTRPATTTTSPATTSTSSTTTSTSSTTTTTRPATTSTSSTSTSTSSTTTSTSSTTTTSSSTTTTTTTVPIRSVGLRGATG